MESGTEQELFRMEELIADFDLDRVHKAGARFDPDKTKWYNHQYMQEQSNDDLAKEFKSVQPQLTTIDVNYISMVIDLIKERATFVSDFWELSRFFFEAPKTFDEKASKKAFKEDTKGLMLELISVIDSIEDFSVETLQTQIKGWITANEIGFGKVMMPLRLALVGELKGPEVFDIMFMIGKAETIKRVENLMLVL